jgi:hypothetical protein
MYSGQDPAFQVRLGQLQAYGPLLDQYSPVGPTPKQLRVLEGPRTPRLFNADKRAEPGLELVRHLVAAPL